MVLVFIASRAALPAYSDPFVSAAEYYFSRQSYPAAFELWSKVLSREPENVSALLRVAELKLLLEGRLASRDILLKFLGQRAGTLTNEAEQLIQSKHTLLQSLFLTDEGQSLYLRAMTKIQRKDFAGAAPLLTHALSLENNNLRILKEKAKCEKYSKAYDRFHETIQSAFESDPYDMEIIDNLVETYVYYKEYPKIVSLFRKTPNNLKTNRQRLAFGIALLEVGIPQDAIFVLQGLIERGKNTAIHPIALYAMGRLMNARGQTVEAGYYWDRFLNTAARTDDILIDGWDPYRSQEKLDGVTQLLGPKGS